MTTNTYQALCDEVGAYEYNNSYKPIRNNLERINNNFIPNFEIDEILKLLDINKKYYYDQSAEQRERLLILIARAEKNYSSTFMVQAFGENLHLTADEQLGDGYSFPAEYEVKGENYPEALYALTHKLVKEGVLSKEEVKEALSGSFKT